MRDCLFLGFKKMSKNIGAKKCIKITEPTRKRQEKVDPARDSQVYVITSGMR
jgi:hypothetical protein